MVVSVRSESSVSRGESSESSEGSTPSSGYVQVGLSENTNLSFERNHSFLNWLLLLVLIGGSSTAAGIFYYAVPLRHELTATVRTHLTSTPFKEGESFFLSAYTGGWRSISSFSRAVELRNIRDSAYVHPETTGFTIAAGAITSWADVEAWLLKVLAPTLFTGSLGGSVVVQLATLHLVKGSLVDNENPNTAKVIYKRLNFDAAEEKTIDFGQLLGGTYAVDATSTIEALGKEGWWGPLTTAATLTIRGRDGRGNECAAKIFFKQSASGLVTADVKVQSVLVSGNAFAFAFSLLYLVASICYCVVEWLAFKLTRRTRRPSRFVMTSVIRSGYTIRCLYKDSTGFEDDRSPLRRYLEERWPCTFVAMTSLLGATLLLACCILSHVITNSEFSSPLVEALEVLEGILGVALIITGWAFILRLLHALSGASIFFLVLEKSTVVFVNEFGGIILVTVLLLLGATACNYILLGPRVPQFRTFTSSLFYTVCLSFGAPFIKSMPPVAFIVAAIGLLVVWVVFVPMLVAINIQSLSAVVKKVRAGQRENLGADIIDRTREWMENNIFFCTPDPKDESRIDEELQKRARMGKDETAAILSEEQDSKKGKANVSEAEDTAAVEYRKLAALFIPFIVLFSLGICFLCDTPRVNREFNKAIEQTLQPFSTTDPFTSREANMKTPPVWMIPRPQCGTIAATFPTNQPQGIRRLLQISSVTSLSGVYDWLEQVLAGQILNAAFNSPSTTNAIPLANPGAVLRLTRIDLECQTFESLAELYPVRRKQAVFRNWTSGTYGGGSFHPSAERVYTVPIYFSGSDAPKTFIAAEVGSGIETAQYKGRGSPSRQVQPTQSAPTKGQSPIDDHSRPQSDVHWTAADFEEIYAGSTSMRTKVQHLRSMNFLDWQLLELEVLWMTYNGDSSMFALNKVVVTMDQGGLKTSLGVTIIPAWHIHPLETGVRPEVIFMPLALLCLLGYLVLSYRAVQKRRVYPLYLIILDMPLALSFACCCFFLLCMYNVAFDPGWTDELSSIAAGTATGSTGNIPKFVPGPVQPWQWLPGSASMPTRSQPPPSAESLPRFLRLQERIETLANYLLFCKICAGLLFVIAMIRFITMVPAIPERMQGLRKLLSHLNAAKVQMACTLCTLFSSFLLFSLIGYCVLGGSYDGFSTYANAVVSCVMLTQSRWNFNSIITIPQQGRSIGWLFQVFCLVVCMFFFGFLNYIVLSMIYVRYESLKAEEAAEMQSALEAKYGVVQRKRVPLMVNDTVILYFKAFVKCLSLQTWGVNLGGEQPVNSGFVNLKDEFFMSLKELPLLVREPRSTQEYISKALLSTQIVRLQQCLTDIEFLRAKHYLILHDLGVIAEQMRVLRQVTRRQGKYVAGIEAAIQHVNDQIEEVQARKAFISYYEQQDPMHARQQMGQQQLFDLGMDAGLQAARRAVVDPNAYIPEERLDLTRWEDPERQRRIEEQRLQHLREDSPPPSLHAARKKQPKEELPVIKSPERTSPKALTPRMGIAGLSTSPSAPPQQSVYHMPGEPPWKAIVTTDGEATQTPNPLKQKDSDSDDEDWDILRQRFGGAHQGTFELREKGGDIVVVKPFPEPPAERLPMVSIPQPQRRSPPRKQAYAKPDGDEEQKLPSRSPSPAAVASAVSSFFADDLGPRPKTNAPEVAEQRAREGITSQRPPQSGLRKQHSRRASASLPTFEAGGKEYRMLPRNRRKRQ